MSERDELRARLVAAARQDPHIDAAALLGSAADLATHEGRGVDATPGPVRAQLATTLAATTDHTDLCHTFRVLVTLLLAETDRQALPVPGRLHQTLDELVASAEGH